MTDLQNVRLGEYPEIHMATRTPNYPYDINTPAWPLCGKVRDNGKAKPNFIDAEVTCEECIEIWDWLEAHRPPEQLRLDLGG